MRAVPNRIESLLARLERARHVRPGARNAESLLRAAGRLVIGDAERLVRLHEAALFLRAYPHGPGVLRLSERILGSFEKRVARLAAADEDLSLFDAPEIAGVAGTVLGTDFSYDLARWLVRRHPGSVRVDWARPTRATGCGPPGRPFFRCSRRRRLPTRTCRTSRGWPRRPGRRRDDLGWLLARYARLPEAEGDRAERFDSLGLPIAWELGAGRASRTKMRRPGPKPFFHDAPLVARRDVSFDAVLSEPPMALRRLPRREGERICDMVRETTAARYREFYTFTHADPASVVAARPGRGVELFLIGIRPDRRLPLRAAYGGFVVKNGVPIGYIEGLTFFERLEIGFNMYYTFREGESAWIYAQVLKLHRDALGVTSFSIDPYQLGYENEEAIESGAFWFYRKLGFRPTDAGVRRLLDREERRIAADPSHRSSAATLRRLVTHNLLYEIPGSPRGEWDRFHIRNLGLAVNRRMERKFGGDAARLRAASEKRVARLLDLRPDRLTAREQAAFREFALVLDLVPGFARWSRREKDDVVAIVRAKARGAESRYMRLLQRHARLRAALIRLGSR